MKCIGYGDVTQNSFYDSRGRKVEAGDLVILEDNYGEYNYGIYNGKNFVRDNNSIVYYRRNSFIVKVDLNLELCNQWLLGINDYIRNPNWTYKGVLCDIIYFENYCHGKYKSVNKKSTTRGFPVTEYLNKPLKMGDLVIIFEPKKAPMYGLYVSSTGIFTQNLKVESKHFALKVDDEYTEEEVKIYEYLIGQYQKSLKKVKNNNTFNFGDVYRDKDYVYIYVGSVKFNYNYLDLSTTYIDMNQLKFGKWIRCLLIENKYDYFDLLSNNIFVDFLQEELENRSKSVEKFYTINSNFVSSYREVNNLNIFVDEISKSAVYGGHLDLQNEYIVDFKDIKKHLYSNLEFYFVFNE